MNDDPNTSEFLSLFAQNHRRIYGYIRSQVACASDADDLLQETSAVLWRKFDEFDQSRDFTRWGCGVARRILLHHFRKTSRHKALFSELVDQMFVDELIEAIETESESTDALADCLRQLPKRQRELVDMRYTAERNVGEIARLLDRSESTVYKALTTVHDALFDCIETKLAKEKS